MNLTESNHKFSAKDNSRGFSGYSLRLSGFKDPKKGFLVKDNCIVGAEIFVSKSMLEKQVNQTVNLTSKRKCKSQVQCLKDEA
ncbi:hypothetical protein TSUD_341240 [Trifolium subterraneum]|uniref:MATH domain-containing protein n=1 Tax=Trifolium subterraneum TaxID=3900 RepID=A0A2Z6LJE3_TRISU|nr:hypothetical protein TSUD_341240 [Trifolium subterraneum]